MKKDRLIDCDLARKDNDMNWCRVVLTTISGMGPATLTLVGCCLLAPLAAVAADSATNAAAPGPLIGYHSEIAKSADTAKWVALDLDQPRSFDAVRLFPARPINYQSDKPGFLFPVRFKLEAAAKADFSDARLLLDKTAADQPNPGTEAPIYHFEPVTARYVRLTVTRLRQRDGDNFAFALAEMQVLNGKDILSKGAKPFALDSIETGAWALANLTDGVLETVKPAESAVVVAVPNQPAPATAAGSDMIAAAAPEGLAKFIRPGLPITVEMGGRPFTFEQKEPGVLENVTGDLVTRITHARDKAYNALWYQLSFTNKGNQRIGGLLIKPFAILVDVDPPKTLPRVRYLTGSQHFDATYPSRAFELVDRAIMLPDHAKPIQIGGGVSKEYVPMMQFALQRGAEMAGFWVAFEWGSAWSMTAGYAGVGFEGMGDSAFGVSGTMNLGEFAVEPNSTLMVPKVHLVFFEGRDWSPLENNGRRYIHERIAYKRPPMAQVNKVTYDHWFGLHGNFNMDVMQRQAQRAAELGCEYFCLDAGWYGKGAFGSSGTGRWDEPDPAKFPAGVADVQRLSKQCRDAGMGFGLWSYLISKNRGADPPFNLNTAAGLDDAVETMRKWIKTYNLTWFRFEMEEAGGLTYQIAWDELMGRITREHPDFHIECCCGGGMRFDLQNMRFCTGTWLSDHTADPDVCRFQQTGALRFWPSYMLNSAVRAHRGSGDREATAYNVISRMPGTLSFNGDIAQWSDEAARRVRTLVDKYKSVRHLQSQPVFFPLPQVRTLEDWDVVCFGDGKGEAQLMYAFRVAGPGKQFINVPDAKGQWSLVMSSDDNVKIEPSGNGFVLSMPPNTASVWIRK